MNTIMTKVLIVAFLAVATLGYKVDKTSDAEKFKLGIRALCKSNNAEEEATQAVAAFESFYNYFATFATDAFAYEFWEAKNKGELNKFFNKYCSKAQEIKTGISTFFGGLYPCLHSTVRNDVTADNAATAEFIDYFCHNDGERPIAFLTEGGSDYLKKNSGYVSDCVTEKRKNITENDNPFDVYRFCGRVVDVFSCALKILEESPLKNAINQGQSLVTFFTKHTFCKDRVKTV
ncbi:unnamed protein product [Pieris macdunnoughi]|uniref:Uncharacterized protein n=1 Tax=Pieris macdunnoughi TaxID=345717 RepID=A0A821V132_9NEOP|nr:unnamed protein product [Pieris macdunnoughi]